MGGSPVNAQNNWPAHGRWIDPADYDHLIDKLVTHPDPEVVYVSGMISWHNQIYLGRCVRLDAGVPDHSAGRHVRISLPGRGGRLVSEVGLPVAWNHAEFKRVMPVTFFGVTLELPRSATSWRSGIAAPARGSARSISIAACPRCTLDDPEPRQVIGRAPLERARPEGSALTYAVLMSPDGEQWGRRRTG